MRDARILIFLMALVLGAGAEVHAARNVPRFELRFTPTQVLGQTSPVPLPEAWRGSPISFQVRDKRQVEMGMVGTRTDDRDDLHQLQALNDVRVFVQGAMDEMIRQWGMNLVDEPDMDGLQADGVYGQDVLLVDLVLLRVVETNQAVGATYVGDVTLTAEFFPTGGSASVRGSGHGDATRYGKKFSNENCNEVISDALLEATSNLVEDLARKTTAAAEYGSSHSEAPPSHGAGPGYPGLTTPESLLSEILMLKASGLSEELLESFIEGRVLTRPLAAAEVLHFKAVLRSDRLLKAILSRPHGKQRPAGDAFTGANP